MYGTSFKVAAMINISKRAQFIIYRYETEEATVTIGNPRYLLTRAGLLGSLVFATYFTAGLLYPLTSTAADAREGLAAQLTA
jgi:hypothetical protein